MDVPDSSTSSAASIRLIISETAGRETPRRSAMRAWMTLTSSSRSSKTASQYSSKAGCHSGDWYSVTAGILGVSLSHPPFSVFTVRRAEFPTEFSFSPPVQAWFDTTFPTPTEAQRQGWPAIAAGDHTLVLAPAGSGKTLAAFLWGIDRLMSEPPPEKGKRTRLLYVSPL